MNGSIAGEVSGFGLLLDSKNFGAQYDPKTICTPHWFSVNLGSFTSDWNTKAVESEVWFIIKIVLEYLEKLFDQYKSYHLALKNEIKEQIQHIFFQLNIPAKWDWRRWVTTNCSLH